MEKTLERVKLGASRSVKAQITESLRGMVATGELESGSKLPPTSTLAAMWVTSEATVQQAFQPLVKEGFLTRTPRLGTFVRKRSSKLTRVGVYHSGDIWEQGGSRMQQALHAELRREWQKDGVEVDAWIDPRPNAEEGTPLPALVQAARERRIQALIVTEPDWPHIAWMSKLPIPVAFGSTDSLPNGVGVNHAQFFKLALQELKHQGCRSVGMLPAYDPQQKNPDGTADSYAKAMDVFVNLAGELGFTLRNEWICRSDRHLYSQAAVQAFGHEAMTALWRQPQRPDGLIVTDDVAATGVVAALLEQSVTVPEQLKLVIKKNSAVDIFCPVPATFVELSTPAVAAALVEQVQRQLRGEACTTISIGFEEKSVK